MHTQTTMAAYCYPKAGHKFILIVLCHELLANVWGMANRQRGWVSNSEAFVLGRTRSARMMGK